MLRRNFLCTGLAMSAAAALPWYQPFSRAFAQANDAKKPKKILYFLDALPPVSGWEHGSGSDVTLKKLGAANNWEIVCTKDGKIFDGDLKQFDCFAFYTSGDLCQGDNALSPEGKKRFLAAIEDGVGFFGFHTASLTCKSFNEIDIDPYITMLGGEFITHGPSQVATVKVTQPAQIPWLKSKGESFEYFDEWYALRKFNKDMRMILTLDTASMKDKVWSLGNVYVGYDRTPFPVHWARMHGKGRVMYTALGHPDDFWQDASWMEFVRDCFGWVLGEYNMDMMPNIDKVAPGAFQYPIE